MCGGVRLRQLISFLFGFLICLIINRVILFGNSSVRQAPFGQIAPHSGDRSPPAPLFHDEESGHHGGDAVVAEETRRKIRLFAFISTTSKYAKKRAAYIKATWARRIEGFLFLSNQDDPSIPAIKTVSNDQMQFQVIDGLLFSYRYNLSDFDYFIKTEDDAYIIPENLRFLLRGFDPSDRIMVGHTPQPNDVQTNMSDHVDYVLSRGALSAVAQGVQNNVPDCRVSNLREDLAMAKCAQAVGVRSIRSVDEQGKQCFHSVAPSVLANYTVFKKGMSKWARSPGVNATDPNEYSDHSALFQHVPEEEMYVLEYLVYHAYPYGVFRDPGVYGRALQILSEALPKKV
ncbi:hypothetical protein AAHC03_0919 [Spirometra sp. Aus1]